MIYYEKKPLFYKTVSIETIQSLADNTYVKLFGRVKQVKIMKDTFAQFFLADERNNHVRCFLKTNRLLFENEGDLMILGKCQLQNEAYVKDSSKRLQIQVFKYCPIDNENMLDFLKQELEHVKKSAVLVNDESLIPKKTTYNPYITENEVIDKILLFAWKAS
jgi:hypothetical protein